MKNENDALFNYLNVSDFTKSRFFLRELVEKSPKNIWKKSRLHHPNTHKDWAESWLDILLIASEVLNECDTK